MAYIDNTHTYINPEEYDSRSKSLLEKYNKKAWDPLINKTGKQYIGSQDIVCDFGCGTLAHYDAMKSAKHIYAIDSNKKMLDFGLQKLSSSQLKNITSVISDATKTSILNNTCSIIWSIGLTEYTDLSNLFEEMTRVATPNAIMLLQFPNAHNFLHIMTRIANSIRNKPTKKFRSLTEITVMAKKFNWQLKSKQTAFIGNNWWCVLQKSNPE